MSWSISPLQRIYLSENLNPTFAPSTTLSVLTMSSQSSLLLPLKHCDKLKIVVVLCGYSAIACGWGMRGIEQQNNLHKFYYRKYPDKVSNVNMLVKELSSYAELYKEVVYQELQEDGKKY